MTKWNCLVKNGYCTGTPDWETKPISPDNVQYYMGTCKSNPETCGKYKSSQQIWDELPQEERDRISKPTYKETLIRDGKIEAETTEKKPTSKKAKKLEGEIAQKSMF